MKALFSRRLKSELVKNLSGDPHNSSGDARVFNLSGELEPS